MKRSLEASAMCRTRAHCNQCRELSPEGEEFRASVAVAYSLPVRDFVCPHSIDWIEASDRPTPPARYEPTPEEREEIEALAADQSKHRAIEICRACEEANTVKVLGIPLTFCGSPLWPSSERNTCGCLMDIKTRIPGMHCPRGKW